MDGPPSDLPPPDVPPQAAEPDVAALVGAAAAGDQQAWDGLVARYTPLVLSVAGRYRLHAHDVADVSQTVWMRLVQHLGDLREPRALPGWIVTTTSNECLRLLRGHQRTQPYDPLSPPPADVERDLRVATVDLDERLLRAERHEALLTAFAELADSQRQLLLLLLEDPPPSYAEVSDRLGIPIGGIGPTRARALDRLRRSAALAALQDERQPSHASLSGARR